VIECVCVVLLHNGRESVRERVCERVILAAARVGEERSSIVWVLPELQRITNSE
jgi:hypothetical protein